MSKLGVGAVVDCVIPQKFTVNGSGQPINVRENGVVLGIDEYGNWEVQWPTGDIFSYEKSLLVVKTS